MKVTIEEVRNGYIVTKESDEPFAEVAVFSDPEGEGMKKPGCDMLQEVVEVFGLHGDRHCKERVRVVIMAGDKYVPASNEVVKSEKFSYIEEMK